MEELQTAQPQIKISRKQFKKMMMPNVGDILCDSLFRVLYCNTGKFWFTASYNNVIPDIGSQIKIEDRIFEITRVIKESKRFNAVFKGFDEKVQEVPEAPVEDQETVKLI